MIEQAYKEFCRTTDTYPKENKLDDLVHGLCSEAGEVAGKVKRIRRDDGGVVTLDRTNQLLAECGDILWYLTRLVDELGYTMTDVREDNYIKLMNRIVKNTIHGSGDNR